MDTFKMFVLLLLVFCMASFPACDDCTIEPDLISDLAAPTTDIIAGEPVDWDYVVESVNDGQDCDILEALASVSKIVIDFFTTPEDTEGDAVFNEQDNISALRSGQSQTVPKLINVFNQEGLYLLTVNADETDVVAERNEDNNFDDAGVDTRFSVPSDLFADAAPEFKAKLSKAAAIVVVGRHFNGGLKVDSYKGKPIYYAK